MSWSTAACPSQTGTPLPFQSPVCHAARSDLIAAAERRCRCSPRRNPQSFRPIKERLDRRRIPRRASAGRRLAHLLEHAAHLLQGNARTRRTHRGNQYRRVLQSVGQPSFQAPPPSNPNSNFPTLCSTLPYRRGFELKPKNFVLFAAIASTWPYPDPSNCHELNVRHHWQEWNRPDLAEIRSASLAASGPRP